MNHRTPEGKSPGARAECVFTPNPASGLHRRRRRARVERFLELATDLHQQQDLDVGQRERRTLPSARNSLDTA